jgi:hypothetical protein
MLQNGSRSVIATTPQQQMIIISGDSRADEIHSGPRATDCAPYAQRIAPTPSLLGPPSLNRSRVAQRSTILNDVSVNMIGGIDNERTTM